MGLSSLASLRSTLPSTMVTRKGAAGGLTASNMGFFVFLFFLGLISAALSTM